MRAPGIYVTVCISIFLIAGIALTTDKAGLQKADRTFDQANNEISPKSLTSSGSANANYVCNLKVYMLEKESRWLDYTQYYHYENGFLDFSFDTILSLGYLETYQETKIWDARAAGFANNADSTYVRQDNMMAIAVLFNPENGGTGYSDPYFDHPEGAPFTINYVDACASATHGSPGWDTAYGLSTHTAFIEEGTEHT